MFKHSDTWSVWCLEYIKMPADVVAIFADNSSDYPFKQSNFFLKKVSNKLHGEASNMSKTT